MAFKKYGDPQPITKAFEIDEDDKTCPVCNKPLAAFAFDLDGTIRLACECETDNIESE